MIENSADVPPCGFGADMLTNMRVTAKQIQYNRSRWESVKKEEKSYYTVGGYIYVWNSWIYRKAVRD
jgi:hypothetical protein